MIFKSGREYLKAKKDVPEPSKEEKELMNYEFYHCSRIRGLRRLRIGGKRLMGWLESPGVYLSTYPRHEHGPNMTKWRLKKPLKIISFENRDWVWKNKRRLQRKGYAGYFWQDSATINTAVVWDPDKDIEFIGEVPEGQRY